MRRQDPIEIACAIVTVTEKAVLIQDGSMERSPYRAMRERQIWIPKSLIEEFDEAAGSITIPEWLAEREGLI